MVDRPARMKSRGIGCHYYVFCSSAAGTYPQVQRLLRSRDGGVRQRTNVSDQGRDRGREEAFLDGWDVDVKPGKRRKLTSRSRDHWAMKLNSVLRHRNVDC